jgi:hypothetical protein
MLFIGQVVNVESKDGGIQNTFRIRLQKVYGSI